MIPTRLHPVAVGLLALAIVVPFTAGCGGGGGGGGIPGGGDGGVIFVADTPSPSAPTISLAPGTVTDDQFQILVRVTQISNFFGASLRIQWDPLIAEYLTFSSAGSVIGGAPTLFDVFEPSSGIIDVVATRQGAGVAGVNVNSTSLLIRLTFRALDNPVGAEPFDVIAPRSVQVCPTAGQPCQKLADGALAWSGGNLTVN